VVIAGFSNVQFFVGRAEELLPQWIAQGIRPDVVVADPPRTGCDAALLKAIIRSRPRRMVYVSCNPSTLAKDCKMLLDGGFRIEWIQPVDMFPQTAHVECIVSTHFTG
jgi:23S rRNA (uracil1939-C5)-methyltransferase